MKIKYFLVGLLLVPSFAISVTAQTRMHQSNALSQAYGSEEGREVAAPSWSAACRLHDRPRPKPVRRAHVGLW